MVKHRESSQYETGQVRLMRSAEEITEKSACISLSRPFPYFAPQPGPLRNRKFGLIQQDQTRKPKTFKVLPLEWIA